MRINRIKIVLLATLLLCLPAFHACIDDKVVDFEKDGVQITAYLKDNSYYNYSEFLKWIEVTGIDRMLNARGNYTCFVPTDEAIMQYYRENETSFEAMEKEEIADLVYGHIIRIENPASEPLESKLFPNGTISFPNMRSRFIQITFDDIGDMFVNQTSKILLADQGTANPYNVRNGVVHTIDRVLEPSRALLTGLAEVHSDRFSLFLEALHLTGLIDSLQTNINEDYNDRVESGEIPEKVTSANSFDDGDGKLKTPESWLIGFTVLMESDETYRNAGINSIEDLKRYAEDNMVPQKPGTFDDPTDRLNSLNRFIAYHIIDRTWDLNDFVPEKWLKYYAKDVTELMDYTTTLNPLGLLEVRRDRNGPKLNLRKDGSAVRVLRISENNVAENGFFHELDNVLIYDAGVENDVLNKRIRMDVTSLMPEMHTNRIVGNCQYIHEGGTGGRVFPEGYLKNIVQLSEASQIQYGGPMNSGWMDLHLDEFLISGKYDLKLRLPPLPPATYEIRIGYTANSNRGVLQIYLDGEPLGIPLNMTIMANNPDIGWQRDGSDRDDPEGLENDKMMRNRGYMKGPALVNTSISGDSQLRDYNGSLRRILTTARLDYEQEHWVRFKSVEEESKREFMFDWIEFVPTSMLDNEDIY